MTQTLAQISPTELTSILALFIGMLGGFYALVRYMLSQHEKTQELDRNERIALTDSFNRVAEATERGAREAEARNGHLAELTIKYKKATLEALDCIKKNVSEQHVDTQVVDEQIIKK